MRNRCCILLSFCKHTRPRVRIGLYWEGFRLHFSSPSLRAWLQEADFLTSIAANCRALVAPIPL